MALKELEEVLCVLLQAAMKKFGALAQVEAMLGGKWSGQPIIGTHLTIRRSLISLLTLIIGFAFCSDFSFEFKPVFLLLLGFLTSSYRFELAVFNYDIFKTFVSNNNYEFQSYILTYYF